MIAALRRKNLHTWLRGWGRHLVSRALERPPGGTRHLLFALCDHYEPLWGDAPAELGRRRVAAWREGYPRLAEQFRDADGRRPRHSFFFPGEQYDPAYLEPLAELARLGLGEVEVHLHHDRDTEETLRRDLRRALDDYSRHGHISRDAAGRPQWAFIHGNWCLANARADGRWCGVDAEIPLLHAEGCYADFTFPAAPDESQPDIVNQLYWPMGDLAERRAYERGERARVGRLRRDRPLLIEGPLALARRPDRLAVRIENGALTAADPGTAARVATWVAQDIHVAGRPEWVFVKVHTHGAPDGEAASLLGDGGLSLHRALSRYNDGAAWKLHYVTAREMYNVAVAAMSGKSGDPQEWFDFSVKRPPVVR